MERQANSACEPRRIKDLGLLAAQLNGATIERAEPSEPILNLDAGLFGYDLLSMQVLSTSGRRLSLTFTVYDAAENAPSILVAEISDLPCPEGGNMEPAHARRRNRK